LREAHAILIDLIRTKEVKIAEGEISKHKEMTKRPQNRQTMSVYTPSTGQGSMISGVELPLSRLFTCKENTTI
jgi:hypothetical protein